MGRTSGIYCDGEPMERLYSRGKGGKIVPLGYFCPKCLKIHFDEVGPVYRAVVLSPGSGRTCRDCAFFLEEGEDGNECPVCTKENEFTNGDDPAGECEHFELSIAVMDQEKGSP